MDIEDIIAATAYAVKPPLHHVCEKTWRIDNLKLPDYDIWYAHKGRGTIWIDRKPYPVRANTLYIFSPGETVDIRQVLPHNITVTLCHFLPRSGDGAFTGRLRMPHMLRLRDHTVRNLFADVVRNSGSAVARTSFVLDILSYLLKRKAVTVHKAVPSGDERYEKLHAMKTYVESHLDRRIGLADLAETIGMDRTSVIRIFARYLHQTPHRYIMHRRLESAQELLAEGCPVQLAARRTGFPDSASFVKAFKAAFHATPGAYRKQHSAIV